jgi:DNA-binding transcriptional LysR family regulator
MLNLNDLRFFVHAAESGGFAAASRRLGLPKSTISKRVGELERQLGLSLVHRSSRRFVLTDPGRDFYDHARAAVIEAEAAESVVHRRLAEPAGMVSITASVPSAQFHLARQLPVLARTYPKLRIRLHVTDRFVDLVQEGFDIAVRSHYGPLPDSDLLQRRLRQDRIVLVASPAYLAERGVPETPEALSDHDGLLIGPSTATWELSGPRQRTVSTSPNPRFFADESLALIGAAEAGLGIAALPHGIAAPALQGGRLAAVLPEWHAGTVTTTILTPHRRSQLPSVRAVIDFLCSRSTDDAGSIP